MTPSVFVGNDVVDLAAPRTHGKVSDGRFVERVYAAEGQRAIATAADPELELWCRWAAKETAFKVVSKLLGAPPPFVHRAFRVAWSQEGRKAGHATGGAAVRTGSVRYQPPGAGRGKELEVSVTVGLLDRALHAVGFVCHQPVESVVSVVPNVALLDAPETPWAGSLEELSALLTPSELDAVYSRPSAAVRIGARAHLAEALGVEQGRIEVVCAPGPTSQRPPRVLLDGEQAAADVTLSHDGRWIAWAIWTG